VVEAGIASSEERLRERDFAEYEPAFALFERLRVAGEVRRTRRRRSARRGDRPDMAALLRATARTGEPLLRRRSRRLEQLRPLVFLCDVSGSMGPYARALLAYARAIRQARPRVHAFSFATRLTDLSWPRARDREPRDMGGGTRIGASLRAFNERYAQRGLARGGTVVILSDGWEREDPDLVASEMARLRRLCRRIVWVNPQKKHASYEPLARGMAAALPYLDAFMEGHNLRSIAAVADAIEGTVPR
jgi:uncharacterized protein with von Willebrand factor type A (vWA) domain